VVTPITSMQSTAMVTTRTAPRGAIPQTGRVPTPSSMGAGGGSLATRLRERKRWRNPQAEEATMAETDSPQSAVDWTENDRLSFTERWNGANAFNLLRPTSGAKEYQTIRQRAFFYDWFDQVREVQGHEILWPAAAWIVATQMSNVENPLKNLFIPKEMKPL